MVPGNALAIAASLPDRDYKIPNHIYNQIALDNIMRGQEWVRTTLKVREMEKEEHNQELVRTPYYNVGDQVLVKNPKVVTETGGQGDKQQFTGPFTIIRKLGAVGYECRLTDPAGRQQSMAVNVDRLRPYVKRVIPSIGSHKVPSSLGELIPPPDVEVMINDPSPPEVSMIDSRDESHQFADQVTKKLEDSTRQASGPASSALARHAHRPTPIYSEDTLFRYPVNEQHRRYGLTAASDHSDRGSSTTSTRRKRH